MAELQSIPVEKVIRVLIDETVKGIKSVDFPVEVVGFPLGASEEFYKSVWVVFDEAVEDDSPMSDSDHELVVGLCAKFCAALTTLGIKNAIMLPGTQEEGPPLGSIRIMFNVAADDIYGVADSVN